MALTATSRRAGPSVGYAGTASDGLTQLDSGRSLTRYSVGARRARRGDRGRHPAPRRIGHAGPRLRPHPGAVGRPAADASLRPPFAAQQERRTRPAGTATTHPDAAAARACAGDRPSRRVRLRPTTWTPNVLKASEDKTFPGAIVASLASPVGPGGATRARYVNGKPSTSAPTARCSPATSTRRSPGCSRTATWPRRAPPRCSCSTRQQLPDRRDAAQLARQRQGRAGHRRATSSTRRRTRS